MSALKNIPASHVSLLAVPFLLPILTLGIVSFPAVFEISPFSQELIAVLLK